ncbi:MAG: hypothetical protein GC150_09295 [Rhizobiales bacterium]|nr:hypothetical protein [Hyphomicrobiales bacterium]
MVDQLLWLDALVKIVAGAFLVFIPRVSVAAFGLPKSDQSFYLRLMGALLLGIAAAIVVGGGGRSVGGLGAAGAGVINLLGAGMLSTLLMLPRATLAMRGRVLLWGVAGVLVVLGVGELLLG